MKTIYCEKLLRITKNKKKLKKILNVKITNRGKEVSVNGNAKDEYTAEKVIDALNFGFPYQDAISIKTEDKEFEILNIKEYTKSHNLERVRARIIGKAGRALKTLSKLSKCSFELKDNKLGIIGYPEKLKLAQESAMSLIKGTKHSNVYQFMEKNQQKPVVDFGLKE